MLAASPAGADQIYARCDRGGGEGADDIRRGRMGILPDRGGESGRLTTAPEIHKDEGDSSCHTLTHMS